MRDGDVVAIMSNGGFGAIHDKLLDELKKDSPQSHGEHGE